MFDFLFGPKTVAGAIAGLLRAQEKLVKVVESRKAKAEARRKRATVLTQRAADDETEAAKADVVLAKLKAITDTETTETAGE